MKRKIFAAFLSLMMVISMLPTSAFATEVDVPADCQHENAHWETVKEATCTVAGVESAHCPDCDKDVTRGIPATGHAPKEEWVVVDGSYEPADCEHAGHETSKDHGWNESEAPVLDRNNRRIRSQRHKTSMAQREHSSKARQNGQTANCGDIDCDDRQDAR